MDRRRQSRRVLLEHASSVGFRIAPMRFPEFSMERMQSAWEHR